MAKNSQRDKEIIPPSGLGKGKGTMSRQQEEIQFLNTFVRLKLGSSPIHGIGVFAMRDIPKGAKLDASAFPTLFTVTPGNLKKIFLDIREEILSRWPQVINGSRFMWPVTNYMAYMNHSDTPNYDAKADVSLQEIAKGEELTEDYTKIENYQKVFTWLDNKKKV